MDDPPYVVVEDATRRRLEDRVRSYIAGGYKPIGGVAISLESSNAMSGGSKVYAQALVLRKPPRPLRDGMFALVDVPMVLNVDSVAVCHRNPLAITREMREIWLWLPLAVGFDPRPGDWLVQGAGGVRLAADGDGIHARFAAMSGRIPAGTRVSGDHPAGIPEEEGNGNQS